MKNMFDMSHAYEKLMSTSDIGASVEPGWRFYCFDFFG
jgi:hypothetical protein